MSDYGQVKMTIREPLKKALANNQVKNQCLRRVLYHRAIQIVYSILGRYSLKNPTLPAFSSARGSKAAGCCCGSSPIVQHSVKIYQLHLIIDLNSYLTAV
jgi:hypothetical protein